MVVVQLLGFAVGVGLFFAIVMFVEWFNWRWRGRPICGFKWPRNWRNFIDDGWRHYPTVVNGKTHKGWYREKPKWDTDA